MRMIRKILLLVAVLGVVQVVAAPLAAQRPPNRPTLWLGAGAGLGWARVTCQVCHPNRGHSLSASVHGGGRISGHVLLGGEVQGWLKNSDPAQDRPADELMLAYSAVVYWYPSTRYSYYLKGGLGLVTYRIDDGTDRLTSSALGPQIGAGWELQLPSHFSVVPFFNVLVASTGADLKFNGTEVLTDASLTLIQLGVGLARR